MRERLAEREPLLVHAQVRAPEPHADLERRLRPGPERGLGRVESRVVVCPRLGGATRGILDQAAMPGVDDPGT